MLNDQPELGKKAGGLCAGQAQGGFELASGDQEGQARAEGHHDRMRNVVGQIADAGEAHAQLDQAAEQGQGENIGHARRFGKAGQGGAAHADRGHGREQDHGNGVGGSGRHEA